MHFLYLEAELPCSCLVLQSEFRDHIVGQPIPIRLGRKHLEDGIQGFVCDLGFDGPATATTTGKWRLELRHLDTFSGFSADTNWRRPLITQVLLSNMPGLIRMSSSLDWGGIQEVTISDCPNLTELAGCLRVVTLEKVTIRNLPKLDIINCGTLGRCTRLREATISNLPLLRQVDEWLMGDCHGPVEIYFGHFPKLEIIKSGFLRNCPLLETATFTDMPRLEIVGSEWLRDCIGLVSVKMSRLPKLEKIGAQFMGFCERPQNQMPRIRTVLEVGEGCHASVTELLSREIEIDEY